ncbi:MAG: DUF4139 domain-containing protein [Pseudomonadota bacterium]
MTRLISFCLTLFLWTMFIAGPASAAGDLALKRVMLSTGGVGYFEYEAEVDGDADLSLRVALDQVDDVLKSVVVYDDRGQVGTISLPGKTPLREVFREMPFGQDALTSPVALLSTLRGAEVSVGGARSLKGRIISVKPETTQLPDGGGAVVRHRVSLMTADGIRQLILEEADLLEFSDPQLRRDIERALSALSELGERDRRTLRINVSGTGKRLVRVAYLIEAPLWKTSYRLTMPDDSLADAADMQGWAVVENLSGEDWQDVELTIVSGNPITFRQALYDTYYVTRNEVPVEVLGRLMPRADDGAVPAAPAADIAVQQEARAAQRYNRRAGASAKISSGVAGVLSMPPVAEAAPAPAPPELARIVASESTEATSYVLFRHPGPVSVANGYSLVVPIIARTFAAERLALYQPETHASHPLAAIRLSNDSATALPPGILTLYERGGDGRVAYVGDATLKTVPAGEKRLLSYALDQKIRIDRETRDENRIASAKIADGLLVLNRKRRLETLYRIVPPADGDRRVLIEQPRQSGWEIVEPASDKVELTASHYRIPTSLEAGTPLAVKVTLERAESQRMQLLSLNQDQIRFYARARELQPEQRKAFEELAVRQQAIQDARVAATREENGLRELIGDQDRLRETLRSVPRESDLFQRYLKTMTENEDSIEAARERVTDGRRAVADAEAELRDFARGLDL